MIVYRIYDLKNKEYLTGTNNRFGVYFMEAHAKGIITGKMQWQNPNMYHDTNASYDNQDRYEIHKFKLEKL